MLLVGGGHSQVEVLRQFADKPVAGVEIVLVSLDEYSLYSGMLPGYIAGHYSLDECLIDLRALAQAAGAEFVQCEVNRIDTDSNRIFCNRGPAFDYDLLSINIGATAATDKIKGVNEHAINVKPVNQFRKKWDGLLQNIKSASRPLSVAVVGGGAGGVELLLAIFHRYRHMQQKHHYEITPEFHLFADTPVLLPAHHEKVRLKLARLFSRCGIQVHLDKRVTGLNTGALLCEDGSIYNVNHVILATQASAPAWIQETGLATDTAGFIQVNECLQSTSHSDVFAAGDICSMVSRHLSKSGVMAVRQGPVLAKNLHQSFCGLPLQTFKPQKHSLALISCGGKYAVASRGAWVAEGRWLWYLKDCIDRHFVRKYSFSRMI